MGTQKLQAARQASGGAAAGGLKLGMQLSVLTGLQIVFSFGIQAYTVYRLGAGVQTDALAAGYTVPQVAMILSTEVLVFVLVPLLAGRPEPELKRNGWQLFVGLGLVFALFTAVLYFSIPAIMAVLVPGFGAPEKHLAVSLARIQVFSLFGAAAYAVLTALHQVRERFLPPLATLLLAQVIGAVVLVWKLPQFGIELVAWIQSFLTIFPALLMLNILGSVRNFSFDFSVLREVFRKIWPLSCGAAYFKTSVLPDRILASFLPPGSIVILDLANRTQAAIERILNQGIATPIIPALATSAKAEDWARFQSLYKNKMREIVLINAGIVAAVLLSYAALAHPATVKFLAHLSGRLGPAGVKTLLVVFVFMSGKFLVSGLNHILANAFYAKSDWTTPTKLNALTYTLGLAVRVGGFFVLGLRGIALAGSLTSVITFVALKSRLSADCRAQTSTHQRPASVEPRSRTAQVAHIARRVTRASIQSVTEW